MMNAAQKAEAAKMVAEHVALGHFGNWTWEAMNVKILVEVLGWVRPGSDGGDRTLSAAQMAARLLRGMYRNTARFWHEKVWLESDLGLVVDLIEFAEERQ